MTRPEPTRWVLATGNAAKLAEFRGLLELRSVELIPLADFAVEGPEETGDTFVENALLKARHAARQTGLPAMADDSGLVVPALGGEPGVLSARYAGANATDDENMNRLLERLAAGADRAAAFHCVVVALRSADDPAPAIGHGVWRGQLTTAGRGTNGFGYDPIFEEPLSGRTAAELDPAEKNAISHRARAVRAIRWQLEQDPGAA